jgi:hypothetical protein
VKKSNIQGGSDVSAFQEESVVRFGTPGEEYDFIEFFAAIAFRAISFSRRILENPGLLEVAGSECPAGVRQGNADPVAGGHFNVSHSIDVPITRTYIQSYSA